MSEILGLHSSLWIILILLCRQAMDQLNSVHFLGALAPISVPFQSLSKAGLLWSLPHVDLRRLVWDFGSGLSHDTRVPLKAVFLWSPCRLVLSTGLYGECFPFSMTFESLQSYHSFPSSFQSLWGYSWNTEGQSICRTEPNWNVALPMLAEEASIMLFARVLFMSLYLHLPKVGCGMWTEFFSWDLQIFLLSKQTVTLFSKLLHQCW